MNNAPSNTAVVRTGKDTFDASTMAQRAIRAANGLRSLGLGENDSVAGLLRNDIAFFDLLEGAALAGLSFTPINWHLTGSEVAYILNDSDAKILVVHEDLLSVVADYLDSAIQVLIVETSNELCEAYDLDRSTFASHTYPAWEIWLGEQSTSGVESTTPGALMLYTSGSTGHPKGVRRVSQAPGDQTTYLHGIGDAFGLHADARVVMTGPLYHAAPLGYARIALMLGCDLLLMPRFDAEGLLQLIETERLTHMHLVPIMFYRLLHLPEAVKRRYDLSSLRSVCHGAAPCPISVKQAMIDWWGPIIREYYGSTEASLSCGSSSAEWLAYPGTVGRPLPGVSLSIIGDDGQPVARGEIGEIYVRQPAAPDFDYHKRPSDRSAIEHDGLVTNGDIGYQNKQGYVFLCDRKNDMIISGGVNIYPAEVEAALIAHPLIGDCAVFGVPDAEYGESVVAALELIDENRPSDAELSQFLQDKLARFKCPKHFRTYQKLPRFDNGKVYKPRLRSDFTDNKP